MKVEPGLLQSGTRGGSRVFVGPQRTRLSSRVRDTFAFHVAHPPNVVPDRDGSDNITVAVLCVEAML